jgi:hypothetical protein
VDAVAVSVPCDDLPRGAQCQPDPETFST